MKFDALKDEYSQLWARMAIRSSFKPALEASARKIIANREKYTSVSGMTNVPWYVIGLIHQMEAGCNFSCHLHNGDSLARRTINVPANRPATGNGPYKWEASACDALLMKRFDAIKDWTVERIAYELERYNGFGYRNYHKDVLTPYLWSGTTHYSRGKYVADGKWSSSAISGQTGAMALLKTLMTLDETIKPGVVEVVAEPLKPAETTAESFKKADEKAPVSKPTVAAVAATVSTVATVSAPAVAPTLPLPAVPEAVTQSVTNIEAWKSTGGQLWTFGAWLTSHPMQGAALALCVAAIWFWPSVLRRKA